MIMNFFSPIGLVSFIDPLHQKTSKSLMLEVAKVLKLTLFSVRSLKSLTPAFSQIFPVTPMFFKILTTGTKGSKILKSEGVPDVKTKGTVVLNDIPVHDGRDTLGCATL